MNKFAEEMSKLENLADLGIQNPSSPPRQFVVPPELPLDNPNDNSARLTGMDAIERFVLAGNSTFTLVSKMTGNRFTFKVVLARRGNSVHFVRLLTGPNNETDFTYIGCIRRGVFLPKVRTAAGTAAFHWFWKKVQSKQDVSISMDFFHEGRCGRCGRKLTVPESIKSGYGPECAGMV